MNAPRVGRFVDTEALAVTWLHGRARATRPGARVGTVRPGDYNGEYVWVTGLGGSDNGDIVVARLDLHAFAPGPRGSAVDLAEWVHQQMAALDGQTVDGQPVYTVGVVSIPMYRFWGPSVDRIVATYQMDLPVLR